MSTRHFLCALLFVAIGSAAQAQRFEAGFVVKSTGDTLRGQIENNFWVEPPKEVRFRASPNAPILVIEPEDISSFALTPGRYFRREMLPLDRQAETRLAQLPTGLVLNQKSEFVLAEILISGSASLLRVALPGAVHYWIRREDQAYIELAERSYMRQINGRLVIADGNNYKSQLYGYFGDCLRVTQVANSTPYTDAGLISLVQLYNQECAASHQLGTNFTLTSASKRRVGFNGGVLGGVRLNTFRLRNQTADGTRYAVLDGLNIDNRLHPLGGLYLDVLHGGRKAALHLEVSMNTYGQTGRFSVPGGPDGRYVWRGTLGTARMGGRNFVSLGQMQSRFFYGAGILVEYLWKQKSLLEYVSPTLPYTQDRFVNAGRINSLAYLEAGWRRDRLTLALDICTYRKVDYYDSLSASLLGTSPAHLGNEYSGRPWSFSATVGFRLNTNPDAVATQ